MTCERISEKYGKYRICRTLRGKLSGYLALIPRVLFQDHLKFCTVKFFIKICLNFANKKQDILYRNIW